MIQQFHAIQTQVRHLEHQAHREPHCVSILAVSKGQSIDKIDALHAAGQHQFGENYVDEALEKISALSHINIEWHFIGRIQSRRCADIAEHFDWVHSVCRPKELERLNHSRPPAKGKLNICIQVNLGSQTKNGLSEDELLPFAKQVLRRKNLNLRGLMFFPDTQPSLDAQRAVFKRARQIYDELNQPPFQLDTLSMGMSQDYQAAILEGSTLIRLGQSLFGPRDKLTEDV